MRIIAPKAFYPLNSGMALFFLAGPVRGGGDWQSRMCLALQEEFRRRKESSSLTIACPCRWDPCHPLARYFAKDEGGHFKRQVDWERYYLELAGTLAVRGCNIFWLPRESAESPHPRPEPYAMDTRGELGEWRWRMRTESAHVVVGAEEGFFGLDQIRRNFSLALECDFPIHKTLRGTAHAAVRCALGS